MDNAMKKLLDRMQTATSSALGTSKKLNAQSTNPDLIHYGKLTQTDFQVLRRKFGDAAVSAYIKQMEMKKMEEQHD